MLRSALHIDCITAAAAAFYRSQESERGDMLNALAPVGMIVHDILTAIGLPENAIEMVMRFDASRLGKMEPTQYAPMTCCFGDDTPATRLIESKDGPRAVCERHAEELAALGYKVAL